MFRLDGKVALVTGGSRGIGRACCEVLSEQGAKVIVHYNRGEEKAREVATGIAGAGREADVVGFDVADTTAVERGFEEVLKKHARVDVLVANAGIAVDGLLLRLRDEDLTRLFDTNVRGALHCARLATRTMMRAKSGRMIFLSSVVGEMGNAGQTAYAVTKAALLGATKSIARELASRNITVNAVAPGYIDTDMTSGMTDAMRAKLLELIPLGRTGSAREIGAACAFLASDEAGYITGQVLRVNGGMYV